MTNIENGGDALQFETPDELLCMAAEIERNAALQYRHLAAEMIRYGNMEAAGIFDKLAAEEDKHAEAVERFQQGSAPSHWASQHRRLGEANVIRQWEGEDQSCYGLTPAAAFDLAVHIEERAFAFFAAIAAENDNQAVRETAERLAREELRHLALVRLERRRMRRQEVLAAKGQDTATDASTEGLHQALTASADILYRIAARNQAAELCGLVAPHLPKMRSDHVRADKTLLQALRDHIIDVDRYCDHLISTVTYGRTTEDIDDWLHYLGQLHKATSRL